MARQSSHSDYSHPSSPSQGHLSASQQLSHQSDTESGCMLGQNPASSSTPSHQGSRLGKRSPILPNLPKLLAEPSSKQAATSSMDQGTGSLSMAEVAKNTARTEPSESQTGILRPDSTANIGEDRRREAILELQETLKQDLTSTIFDSADLEEPLSRSDSDLPERTLFHSGIASPEMTSIEMSSGRTADIAENRQESAMSEETEQTTERRKRRNRKKKKLSQRFGSAWSITWLVITACFSGVGLFAFRWMTSLPPAPDCQNLSAMAADVERLHCTHLEAKSGSVESLLAGFDLVRPWTSEHPSFWKAQSMMERWTKDILILAESTLYTKGFDEAVALVEAVPSTSPLFDQAQATLQEWNNLWSQGEAIVNIALDAVQADQWDVAAQQVVELGKIEHNYWRQERANELSLRILAERQGKQIYEDVKAIADTDNIDELALALAKLDQLEPDTFIWNTAQSDVVEWSKDLAKTSLERFRSGDTEGALALIQSLPAHPDLVPGAADLVRFGYAQRQAAEDPEDWDSGVTPITGFMAALAVAQEIPADSPFYDQAQIQMVQWRRQLEDVAQLQLAQTIASTGHRWLFDVAIDQASMVEKGQPRRLQAQTLLAHWRQEIERVEDRPQLVLAKRIAETGTIEALEQAIGQAQGIPDDRALRQDADRAIAQWTGQIQTIEDQPILDSALALAEAGNLSQAITEASKIEPDRALYSSAQAKVGEWRTTIAIAQNQRLLARARSLAGQTRLTEAINVASGISTASPAIYQEARSAMAQWQNQRARIRAARRPAPSPSRTRQTSSSSPASSPSPSPAPSPAPSVSFDGYYGPNYGN
ncbi:MAG: hypothetical protein AAGD25_10005 [Cyanobacteria bacterium P01_F01_bin.150]